MLLSQQKTIKQPAEVAGRGLFSGVQSRLRFCPAPENTGIVFLRTDLPEPTRISANISNVAKRDRTTCLVNGPVVVETVEHVLAGAAGLGIDNLLIEINAAEIPSTDGSAQPFVEALQGAGIETQQAQQDEFVITEPITVTDGDATLTAGPGSSTDLDILYDMDYSDIPGIGRQLFAFRLGSDDFNAQLAPARTFCLEAEAKAMQANGMAGHLSPSDVLVIGENGPIDNQLRFKDELVRHKIVDLIGDLALMGKPIRGRVVAYKSGHRLNQKLVGELADLNTASKMDKPVINEPEMDIRKIMRLLRHRYPFLMVDRIIEIEADRRAVGIKNVTINEPFFQGHFPGIPVMPGVLILEALAQVSGLLVTQSLEHTGKVGYLVSMDRVKLRKPVRPGDQLILESEVRHLRPRSAHCQCVAKVAGEIAAEAEIKFVLVDADPA